MTTNLVVRLNNFSMWKVSTSKAKSTPKEFLSGDRQRYSLPGIYFCEKKNIFTRTFTQFSRKVQPKFAARRTFFIW